MRKLVLVVLLVVSLLPHAAAQEPSIGDVPDGIRLLLEDRGRAWVTKDADLLASTLGPRYAQKEMPAFTNAADVRFAQYDFEVLTKYSGDLAVPRVKALHEGAAEVRAYHVEERTRIEGAETVPFIEDSFVTFVRGARGADRYDGWRVASTSDFDVMAVFSSAHLWDSGKVLVRESEHFVALAHEDRIQTVEEFLPEAEQAFDEVDEFWPRPVGQRYVIVVPSSTDELQHMFKATSDLSKFVAFAAGSSDRRNGWEPAGVRIFLNPPNFSRYNAEGRRLIFAHELIHAVTRPLSGPFIPTWVEEGLANIGSEGDDRTAAARRGDKPADFPEEEQFYVGATEDIVTVYRQSQVAFLALVDHGGVEMAARFYETLGGVRTAPGTSEYHTRQAIEKAGWSLDAWRDAWLSRL